MERSLLWSAFAVGLVGWIGGWLLTRTGRGEPKAEDGPSRPYWWTAMGLPLLIFLATLPSRPPFAAGQGFGRGFLLGGMGALLAAWVVARSGRKAPRLQGDAAGITCAAAAVAAPYAMGLIVAVTPLLWMRETLEDALLGGAIGWFTVTLTLLLGLCERNGFSPRTVHPHFEEKIAPTPNLSPKNRGGEPGFPQSGGGSGANAGMALALASGIGFVVTLCAVAAIGEFREKVTLTHVPLPISWSALGMVFAAGVPFALLVSALPNPLFAHVVLRMPLAGLVTRLFSGFFQSEEARHAGARGWRLLLSVALLLGLGKLIAMRVEDQPHLWRLLGIGVLVGLIVWWVTASQARQERTESAAIPAGSWQSGMVAALVIAAGAMAAYQMLAGFGVGLLLIAVWLSVGLAVSSALESDGMQSAVSPATDAPHSRQALRLRTAGHLTRLALLGVVLLIYRLVSTRFESELRGVSLSDNYALFGFLVGAMAPTALAGFLLRPIADSQATSGGQMFRLIVTGILALLVPALVIVLWGAKCLLALLFGLALACALFTPAVRSEEDQTAGSSLAALLPALLAVALALALGQWTHHVLPYALLSRAAKIKLIYRTIACVIALILLSDYGGRFRAWQRSRREGRTPVLSSEGAAQ